MSLQIGRVILTESVMRPFEESWSSDGRTVSLSGILHSNPSMPRVWMQQLHDDILGLPLSIVPVVFGMKSHRNGYYRVSSAQSSLVEITDQNLIQLTWQVDIVRLGNDSEIDLESRLAGPTNRLNDFSLGGERWHAPAQAHTAYWAGSATPAQVARTGGEGAIKIYRGIPDDAMPRWQCNVEDYGVGRVRLVDLEERAGTGIQVDPIQWEINNSLLAVMPSSTGLDLYTHDGTDFGDAKEWNLTVGGTPLGNPLAVSVLYNEYERVTIRLLWNRTPSGRVMADVTMRRGSYFVEVLLKSNSAVTFGIARATNEAGTSGSGFVRATSDDAEGNRYIIGSLRTFTGDLTAGGISLTSTVKLDAIIGVEKGGAAALDGNQADDLIKQYVGIPSEVVQAVRR
jgi:hypothetical protein